MKNYKVIFLKAIMNRDFETAYKSLQKLSVINDMDMKQMLFSLGGDAAFALNEPHLSTYLSNFALFRDYLSKTEDTEQIKQNLLQDIKTAIKAKKNGCSKEVEIYHLKTILEGLEIFIEAKKAEKKY